MSRQKTITGRTRPTLLRRRPVPWHFDDWAAI
ncbi:hypothetical protein ACSSV4_001168 [Roseovarius sp. MBR-154]|jgi:hypothetical protein